MDFINGSISGAPQPPEASEGTHDSTAAQQQRVTTMDTPVATPSTAPIGAAAGTRLRVLVVRDVDVHAASRLVDAFIQAAEPRFDAVIACGPLSHRDVKTAEDEAMALGDVATVLAQLENISCRVLYLAAPSDPGEAIFREQHLTPNALNLHARWLPLVPGLRIGGYTERSQLDRGAAQREGRDDYEDEEEGDSDDEVNYDDDDVERVQGGRSADIVREVLMGVPNDSSDSSSGGSNSGVSGLLDASLFVLHSQHMHTTNQLLFFSQDELRHAGVTTLIISDMGGNSSNSTSSSTSSGAVPEPRDINGVRAVFLGGLRESRTYLEAELALCERLRSSDGTREMKWVLINTTQKRL